MTKNNSAPDIIEIGGVKYQKVEEEPKKPQTLYDAIELSNYTYEYYFSKEQKHYLCKVVDKWLFQFRPEDMSFGNLSHINAFLDALDLARKTLR